MTGNKGKHILINLSDDDEDISDDHIDLTSSSSEDCCELIDDDDDDDDDNDFCSGEEEEDDEGSDDRCEEDDDDEDVVYNRVLKFLQGKRDLQELSLKASKSYLRKHGLRVSGTKDVCVQRVLEHWRIKDGAAETLYPRSSFNINCKGDVCRGDVVLFTQKVYGSFDKVTRNGKLLGKRTIAGRVVKESYGAAKQQHTFTVEVLWSKGVKKLPPLFPLLVKGRNLYRLNTCRQPWKSEGERRKILDEKHTRGTAARLKREKRKKDWSSGKGLKSQKVGHGPWSSKMSSSRGGKDLSEDHRVSTSKHPTTNSSRQQNALKQGAIKHAAKTKSSKLFKKYQATTLLSHHTAAWENPMPPGRFQYGIMPSDSGIANYSHFPHHGPLSIPAAQYTGSSNPSYYSQPVRIIHENYLQYFPSRVASGQQQYGFLRCSMLGCIGPGSDRCVIAACWRCCRREGMRCNVHR
ncbi:hypothetical protein vseg_005191 [Gypsophila vaccaria]